MNKQLDVYPSRDNTLVDVILRNRTANWRELLLASIPETHRVRIYTDPFRRVKQIKEFYYSLRRCYPQIPQMALDYALEMYLLGWIDPYQVITVAKQYMNFDVRLPLVSNELPF